MSNEHFEIDGMAEITAALKDLPVKIQAKILKAFLRKTGNKFIVNELKARLNYSQQTERSIKVVDANSNRELAVQAGVSSKGFKLRWTDLGTKERKTKKGGDRGKIDGKNQIQPTIEEQIEPIVKYAQEELGNEINKILERRLKKLRKG